jgi:integrase
MTADIPLPSISPEHFDACKFTRWKDKIKPISVNAELRGLRAMFSTASHCRKVDYHPFSGCARVPVPQVSSAFLSGENLERLLAVIREPWLRDVIVFAAKTGLRRGEIVNLT